MNRVTTNLAKLHTTTGSGIMIASTVPQDDATNHPSKEIQI